MSETEENLNLDIVIGRVYGQTISGTLFKHKVLRIKETWNNIIYCFVENVETGHQQFIKGAELHDL